MAVTSMSTNSIVGNKKYISMSARIGQYIPVIQTHLGV
jgi:hypothetical protein